LAHKAALTLESGATQLRLAKFGAEAILARLDELRALPATADGSPHPRAVQITWYVQRALQLLDTRLDAAYCETHTLLFQLDKTIGQWELEDLAPTKH